MLTVLWLNWRCFNRAAVAVKEYAKVECSVSALKEAKDRDFGTRYVINRSQIHILFLEATILDKSPWDSAAIFIIFCHFSAPS